MVQLRLICLRLGEGGEAEVEIDGSRTVLGLKNKILAQLFKTSEEILVFELRLFLARTKLRGEDVWLGSKDPLVGQLRSGEIPPEVERLYLKDEIEDPADALSAILPLSFPKTGRIHVLVKVSVKRRRLENAKPLMEVPHIVIKGAGYVTLPGEFVAKCGLNPGGDLMLYCRPQVHELWEFLEDEVVAKNSRGWIVGPPGSGKSACLLSFAASLDTQEWNVVWIHLDEKGDSCVSTGSKEHALVDDRSTFELPRVGDEKLFVCLDGYTRCDEHTALLRRILVRLIQEQDRLVVCSSMATCGKRPAESDSFARIKPFFMYSWTLDEYIDAVSDPAFYAQVARKFDAPNESEVNGDDDDENTLSQQDQKLRLLRLKFYYAGGSCRFMFQYSTDFVKKSVKDGIQSVRDKTDLVRYCSGVFDKDPVNRLYGLQPDATLDGGRFPVSSFVASLFAQESGEEAIAELAAHLNKSDNPSVDGHLFEWLFLAAVPKRAVKLAGANNAVDVLPRGNIFQFNPKKKFKTSPAPKKKGAISGKREGNKYDITYDDGEKDASVDACFIGILKGETGVPQDEYQVGDSEGGNTRHPGRSEMVAARRLEPERLGRGVLRHGDQQSHLRPGEPIGQAHAQHALLPGSAREASDGGDGVSGRGNLLHRQAESTRGLFIRQH